MVSEEELKYVKIYADKFLKYYKRYCLILARNLIKTNPNSMKLYNENNIQLYYIKLNDKHFKDNKKLYFIYDTNNTKNVIYQDLQKECLYTYETPVFEKTAEDIFLSYFTNYSNKDILHGLNIWDSTIEILKDGLYEPVEERAITAVNEHAREYYLHINYQQSYYANNAARYAYSELDLIPIIEKVNNEDFSYQIDQAIAAYDNSLYLASCATLGVCLETVCKLLLTKNGIKTKDSDPTMLDKLGEKLKSNNLINYKLKGRIDVCYKVRNLSSHTSPGKIVKSDCHFLLNTISEVVETHF